MGLTNKDIEQLEAYWADALPDAEIASVQEKLRKDEVFKVEADSLKTTITGLHLLREKKVRSYLTDIEKTLPPVDVKKRSRWWKFLLLGLIMVILLGLLIWPPVKKKTKEQALFEKYFEPYEYLGQTLSQVDEVYPFYVNGDFAKAIPLLEKRFEETKDTLTYFYLAEAYLGNGEGEKAISILEELKNSKNSPREFVLIHLALIYLDSNKIEKAISNLELITNNKTAKSILLDISNLKQHENQ